MIKLFLCDVDGTLTDGVYHTTEKGEISKSFYTRDFHGLWMLDQSGVKVCIITAANDDVIVQQCKRGARYADLIKGSKDKLISIEQRILFESATEPGKPKLKWDEIAFIGDDVFDIGLLLAVGLHACPSDADPSVKRLVDPNLSHNGEGFLTHFPGGKGCVREFAEYVLSANKAERK